MVIEKAIESARRAAASGPGAASVLRVLGVDPGSRVTGFGVIDCAGARLRHVAHGTVRLGGQTSQAGRLDRLHRAIADVIAQHRPDVASVEQVFVASSPRAALVLGQARGAALVALGEAGLAVHEYTPAQIKQTVAGSGRAAKAQIQQMVRRLLALESRPAADAADALAAAICHAHMGRLAGLGVTPRRRRRAGSGSRVSVRRSL